MSQTDRSASTEWDNWVGCVLGLKYLSNGLKGVTTRIIEKQHKNILKSLPQFEGSCKLCTLNKLLPFHLQEKLDCPYQGQKKKCFCSKQRGRLPCPTTFCSKLFDEIVKRHRFRDPEWKNTDPTKWKECPWSIATCFINTAGYEGENADTTDCSGILSIIINNLDFEIELGVTIDDFQEARKVRNVILHSPTYELTDNDFHKNISLFIGILEMPQLKSEEGVKDALQVLTKIQKKERPFTSAVRHDAEQNIIEELKRLKMSMIKDIVEFLKEKKTQERTAFVDSYNSLLRYHLLLQHASRETLINRFEREATKQNTPVKNMLISHKENIVPSLEENEIKTLLLEDGTINTNLNKMGVSLICKLILNIFDSGENRSGSFTDEEIEAIRYILEEKLKMQELDVQLDHKSVRQKCRKIHKHLLILLEDKTENSKEDSRRGLKCKTLLILYRYRMESIDALSRLLKENVDNIESPFLETVKDRLAKVNYKESPETEDVLDSQNKTLELMLKLNSCRNIEKDLHTCEVIEGQIRVNCVSESRSAIGNATLLKCVMECTENGVNDEEPPSIQDQGQATLMTKLKPIVLHGLSFLIGITCAVLYKARRGSTILQIQCSTCEAIYKVLTELNGPSFQDFLFEIQACLESEMKETFDVSGHVTPESLQKVKEHLIEQELIKATDTNVKCKYHQDEIVECYCPKHKQFCCKTCLLELGHRGCIEQVREVKIEPAKVNDGKEHNTRIATDPNECWIRASTVLENGEVLLADFGNSNLKKMNNAFQIISHCNLPQTPTDVCSIGNGIAAVSLSNSTIQFVDISDLTLTYQVQLDHPCYGLAESDSVIYTTDDKSVYTYNKNGTEKKLLYRDTSGNVRLRKLAVSDDRETIYITNLNGSLVIIGKGGELLATVRHPNLKRPEDVCISDEGSVLVCDSESATVLRVKYVGKRDIQKDVVFKDFDGLNDPFSVSVDKKSLNVIVGEYKKDEIIVLPLHK